MFALVIAVVAMLLVVFLCFATIYYGAPDKLPEFIGLFVSLFVLYGIHSFWKYKSIMKKYKKFVEEKKKEVKMLRDNEIKDYLVNALIKGELYTSSVKDILSVLKIGRLKRDEIEKDVIETYNKRLHNTVSNHLTTTH